MLKMQTMGPSAESATEGWLCAHWPFHTHYISFLCSCENHLAEGCASHSLTTEWFSTRFRRCQSQKRSVLKSAGVAFPSPASLLGSGDVWWDAPSEGESVSIGVRIRPGLLAVLWERKKGLGTRVILCLHWFQRLFTCKCFCNFPFPFQHIYSEGKRFAQWRLGESPSELRAAKVRKWNTCLSPRQFFFFLIRSAVTQGKGPSTGPDVSLVVRK